MRQQQNIEWVTANGLCTGCGTCVAVCPQDSVSMTETPGGLLVAEVDHVTCNLCGLCTKACPGWHLERGLLTSVSDPFKGRVIAAFWGQAKDKKLLCGAQSGGVITALLRHLIDSGQIDKAVVTKMSEDGRLRAAAMATQNPDRLLEARGSKYCPVAVNASIKDVRQAERLAVVGLGCHVHGVRNAQSQQHQSFLNTSLLIGLVCDRTLSYRAMDYLIHKARLLSNDVVCFEFRSKRWRGWPGDVYLRTRSGIERNLSRTYRILCKDTFTPYRCRLCFDKLNSLSDLTVGDAWGVSEHKEGVSVILVRTPRGLDALLSGEKAGLIRLGSIEPSAIFEGQAVERRRTDWAAYTAACRDMGHPVPEFCMDDRWGADISAVSLRPYRRELKWATYLSGQRSCERALNSAKRHLLLSRLGGFLSARRAAKRLLNQWHTLWAE